MSLGPRLVVRTLLLGASMAACLAASTAASAQDAAAPAAAATTVAEAVEAGRRLYVNSCQRCHGIRLVSFGLGFDLRTFPQNEKERFVRSVNNGLRAMPAWNGTLKPEQVDLIWTYIGSINGWKTEAAASVP